jgi:NH3-dependent NAD+ synthetase
MLLVQQMITVANPMIYSSENAKTTESSTIRRRSQDTKTVTFGSVVINEHPIIVGCHPSVSSGVPITIGWYAVTKTEMSLQKYEELREPERVSHRLLLKQHPSERFMLLQNLGFSRQELHRAEEAAKAIRELREESFLDDVDSGDKQLRRRLKILYAHAQQLKQQQLLKEQQQRQQSLSSKPVLSKMLRRFVGGNGTTNHSNVTATVSYHLSSKRKSFTTVAAH